MIGGNLQEIARSSRPLDVDVGSPEISLGNRMVCVPLPGDWKYEMIEIWGRHSLWGGENDGIVQDREGMIKKGNSPIFGAHYSARPGACEYLLQVKRSARGIILRIIIGEYRVSLGTWVVREATRKAMAHLPVVCEYVADFGQVSALIGTDT